MSFDNTKSKIMKSKTMKFRTILISCFLLATVALAACSISPVNQTTAEAHNSNITVELNKKDESNKANDSKSSDAENTVDFYDITKANTGQGTKISEEETTEIERTEAEAAEAETAEVEIRYKFRNNTLLTEHFKKHGNEFPYNTKEEYLQGANIMLENPNKLHKIEKEDGDDVYYLESTNEFIIVSRDGYIRTYFKPSRGIDYFNRQ